MMNDLEIRDLIEAEILHPTAVGAITRAEIDVQVATARAYPRSLKRFRDRAIEMATIDEETAESCFYTLMREGKTIEGPGIRLAEIVAAAYGNIRAGCRVIDIDEKFITAQGFVHDLESNVAYFTEVKRRITNRAGRRYSDDMIVTTANAACSIALRNAIFKGVPKSLVDPVYREAKRVAVGDASTLEQRRGRALEHFNRLGISTERILALLGRMGIEEIDLADLEKLTGLRTAVRDGEISIEEAFPAPITVMAPLFGRRTVETGESALRAIVNAPPASPEPSSTLEEKNDDAEMIPFNRYPGAGGADADA
jgi:hypothetical protein